MNDHTNRSALDALVEQNMSLRDEVDELTDERDAAKREATERANEKPKQVSKRTGPSIGYINGEQAGDEEPGDEQQDDSDLASVIAERDSYLADSQRLAADFANYRKQSDKRVVEAAASQSAALVKNLLPVLDACDSALDLDPDSPVTPIRAALLGELERSGLSVLAPEPGDPFDPEMHEAVMHEADDDPPDEEQEPKAARVAEVFRAGYAWKGRVVRPAMVKVIG